MFSYFGPFAQSHGENGAHKQASKGGGGETWCFTIISEREREMERERDHLGVQRDRDRDRQTDRQTRECERQRVERERFDNAA